MHIHIFILHIHNAVFPEYLQYDTETKKIKKGRSKTTYFFFFILNLSKCKSFYNFGPQTTTHKKVS